MLNSDHNPLSHLRSQPDPRGKSGRWVSELEEYDYTFRYIRGKENVKADALSRLTNASSEQPHSHFEEKVYALFIHHKDFPSQLKEEQQKDSTIVKCMKQLSAGTNVLHGRLKRVQKQLRIQEGLLTKSFRPFIPPSLRKLVVAEYHNMAHLGIDRIYSLLKARCYWPNMYAYIRTFISSCDTCQRTKCITAPPKAPLVEMFIPSAPMQFISLDIAYLPKDHKGYQYILLIGDIFSKYIAAIPLKDQTAPVIVDALLQHWIFVHGTPFYILSDQGSNVDGNVMRQICTTLTIEKRRSSSYHSHEHVSVSDHLHTISSNLNDIFDQVMRSLALSKTEMQRHYNKNILFNNYGEGQKVWLKSKHYKSGENRKLAPRRNGPWTVLQKLPNGVNFRIENSRKEQKVVHHDRLLPFIERDTDLQSDDELIEHDIPEDERSVASESLSDSSGSDYEETRPEDPNPQLQEDNAPQKNYPRRNKRVRTLPDTIPWSVIDI